MQNYLAYRWPSKVPEPPSYNRMRKKKKRRLIRTVLIVIGSVVLIALLAAGAFYGSYLLAEYTAARGHADLPPSVLPSNKADFSSSWSPEDLPWGEPDPDARISLSASGGPLSGSEIYQAVLPSIVGITASAPGGYGMGTGIIATSDGYIVTNYHVIDESLRIRIILLSDGSSYDAQVIGFDAEKDIAVLKISAEGLTPASFGSSDDLSVGDPVYAVGNPMGYLYGSMTDGIISALPRSHDIEGNTMYLIQTSAALNSGNSGGALVNQYGQVVGITVAKISDSDSEVTIEGLGLVIPISDALPFLNHILHTGETWRPAVGIICYETEADGVRGVCVQSVTAGGPADGVLLPDDVILAANGADTPTLYSLTRILGDTGVGGTVELTVFRAGETLTLSVTLYDSLAG